MLGISFIAPLLGALKERETVRSLVRRKWDAMYDELLLGGYSRSCLFDIFSPGGNRKRPSDGSGCTRISDSGPLEILREGAKLDGWRVIIDWRGLA